PAVLDLPGTHRQGLDHDPVPGDDPAHQDLAQCLEPPAQIEHVVGQPQEQDHQQRQHDPGDRFGVPEDPAEEAELAGQPEPERESGDDRHAAELHDRLFVLVAGADLLVAGEPLAHGADDRGKQEGDRETERDQQDVASHAPWPESACPKSRMAGTTTRSSSMEIAPARTTFSRVPVQSTMVEGRVSASSCAAREPPSRYTSTDSPSWATASS